MLISQIVLPNSAAGSFVFQKSKGKAALPEVPSGADHSSLNLKLHLK